MVILAVSSIEPSIAETRVALVIGNAAYHHASPLKNARNDANDFAARLGRLGFDVVKGLDLTIKDFRGVLDRYQQKLRNADVAVLYYSGHGVAVDGVNYLVPVDSRTTSLDRLDDELVSLGEIRALMDAWPRTNVLLFDACRDNPFARSMSRSVSRHRSVRRGLLPIAAPKGTYISFATEPGDVASDGSGRNSPFTSALLKHIETPDIDIQLMMRRVRRDVIRETKNTQVPWERSSLIGKFSFAPNDLRTRSDAWISTDKPRYHKGETVTLHISPPRDCRLTLLNVDDDGTSCMLFPHPQLADETIKAGNRMVFPPQGVLRLDRPGKETFIALCNASSAAKKAASRQNRRIDCSVGAGDQSFNDGAFEVATFDFSGDSIKPRFAADERSLFRSSVTVEVTAD